MPLEPRRAQAVFLAALEHQDQAGRAEVLDRECSSDAELRRQVEALLRGYDEPDSLLTLPPSQFADRATSFVTEGGDGPFDGGEFQMMTEFTLENTTTSRDGPAHGFGRPSIDSAGGNPGARIGPYKLLQKIGEGGMGTVYMAEQETPVRRRVALKIIKPGMDTAQVVARFEAERQALALMDHQNIARVLDAGTTEGGRPYFVMELVHGFPITQYCDEAQLTTRERLELFVPVCQAIQHAHQKGIIHRDIKPSNILVTLYDGNPVAKVIDFGIAKATDQQLTERTMFTHYGSIVGTLEYMSPEQAEMSALGVDTRSDIYSLGVVLYELLTGSTPLERARLRDAGYVEILAWIKEEEPQKPSARLSSSGDRLVSLSSQRKTEPGKLSKVMRGELDWIVMKALEKDRNRRYETANAFARDIQRFLADETVEACPPSTGYRLRKLARKHRAALTTVSAIAALLMVGAVVSTWQAIRATRAEHRAEREAWRAIVAEGRSRVERDRAVAAEAQAKAESANAKQSAAEAHAVLGFFEDHILAAARPQGQQGGLGKDVTLRAAVDAAEPNIAEAFREQPTVEGYVRHSLGNTYRYLGELPLTVRQHERALELRKAELGPDHPDTLTSQNALALAYMDAGRLDRAISLFERALEVETAKLGADHLDTLTTRNNLALACIDDGRLDRAIPLFESTLAARTAKLGANHADTIATQNYLAVAYKNSGRLDRAIPLFEQTLAARTTKLGTDHPDTLVSQNNLAAAYKNSGRLDRAIPLFEQTLAARTAKLGADHPNTLNSQNNLASAYRDAGQFERAIPLLERTLAARMVKLGADHPDTFASQYSLALAYKDAGRLDDAIALLERTLTARKAGLGPDHPDNLKTQNALALAYRDAGQYERAIAQFERTLDGETASLGADHPDTLTTQNNLALTYRDDGQWDRAIALFEKTLSARTAKLGIDHPDTLLTRQNLAMAYREAGLWGQAIPIFEQTLAVQTAKLGPDHPFTLLTQNNLAPAYQAVGQIDRAIELLEKTLAARVSKLGADHPSTLTTQNNLALAYQAEGQLDRAIALFERTLAARTIKHGADNPRTLTTQFDLAVAYEARGDTARVEAMLRDVLAARKKKLGLNHLEVAQTLSALGANLLAQEKCAEAESLLREGLSIRDEKRPDDWSRSDTRSLLGGSLLRQKKYAEAERLLVTGYDEMKARELKIPAASKKRLTESGARVVELYESWGKGDKAGEWRQRLETDAKPPMTRGVR